MPRAQKKSVATTQTLPFAPRVPARPFVDPEEVAKTYTKNRPQLQT
jgi:hypothetical protein